MLRGKWVPPGLKDKNRDLEQELIDNIYCLMKHMNWGFKETLDIPIPPYFDIIKNMEKEAKEAKRKMK